MPAKQFAFMRFFEKSLDFSIHFFSSWLQGGSICLRHPLFQESCFFLFFLLAEKKGGMGAVVVVVVLIVVVKGPV